MLETTSNSNNFIDYSKGQKMLDLIPKDQNGCFKLEVVKIERVSFDCFMYTF